MRLYIDLDSLQLIEAPGVRQPVTEIRAKRGTSKPLELQFVRAGEPELLPAGTVIRFGPKETGKYDGDFIVFTDNFVTPGSASGFYTGTASFNTTQLNTLLRSPDGDPDNDVDSVTLMSEFSWQTPGNDPEKTDTFNVVVANAVDNGGEAAPTTAGPDFNTRVSAIEAQLDGTDPIDHLKADRATISGATTPLVTITSSGTGGSSVVDLETTNMDFASLAFRYTHLGSVVWSLDYDGAMILGRNTPGIQFGTVTDAPRLRGNGIALEVRSSTSGVPAPFVCGDFTSYGNIILAGLPTYDPLSPGVLWNDGGTLKIST